MAKPLKVGLIGANPAGDWARDSHIPALQRLDSFELTAVAGRSQQAADAAAQAFGVAKSYGDSADMFRDPDIDIITIAVTLPAHRALVLSALKAGKHVYCEYPLGLDVEQSRELEHAALAAGVHAAIGLQSRANPAVRQARALLAVGAIGRPLSGRMISTTAGFGPHVGNAVAYTEDPASGVTLVTIQAAHTIDLAIALLGRPTDITALASTRFPQIRIGDGELQSRRIYDHIVPQARLSNSAVLSAEVAGGRSPTAPFRFEIVGDAGTLVLEGGALRGFQSGRMRLLRNDEPQPIDEGDLAALPDAAVNVAATYGLLAKDIAEGTSSVPGFSHAVRLAQLIADATASSENGRRATGGDWPTA